jgi:DNA repair exonuclease SbcCD ATPase subunit
MSELKLRRVHIRNWMTIRQAELTFPKQGLVLVNGDNLASAGKMSSVGAGKTALGEALCRTLTGIDGRYTNLGHYSTHGKGNMYVRVETDLSQKPLVVELGHKCKEISPTGEGLRFKFDDQGIIERGYVRETRQELASAISVTPELAEWTVYIDGDRLRFNKQSERDSVGLLMAALQQPSWDKINEHSRKMLGNAQRDAESEETRLNWLKGEKERLEEAIKSALRTLQDEKDRIAEEEAKIAAQCTEVQNRLSIRQDHVAKLQARQAAIKSELKRLEVEGAAAYAQLEKKRLALNTDASTLQIKRNDLVEKKAKAFTAQQAQVKVLDEMRSIPDNCPTCGKPWDKAHSADEIKKQELAVVSFKKSYDGVVVKIQDVDKSAGDIRNQVRAIEEQISKLRTPAQSSTLSYEYEENERDINLSNSAINQAQLRLQALSRGPDRSGIERYGAVVTERKDQSAKITTDVEETSAKLAEAQEVVKVVGYWTEAFSPTGIPNLILSEAIAPLNEISRRISNLMTGGTIEVSYDTSRQLASGKGTSSELVIRVNNKIGSKRIEGSSKGESGLTNLIIAETLSEVGSVSKRIGFRWYDEILSSQDTVIRRSILTYLKETAHRLGILIFVVDHHPEVASYADYVLVAQKTGQGETKLSWKTNASFD